MKTKNPVLFRGVRSGLRLQIFLSCIIEANDETDPLWPALRRALCVALEFMTAL